MSTVSSSSGKQSDDAIAERMARALRVAMKAADEAGVKLVNQEGYAEAGYEVPKSWITYGPGSIAPCSYGGPHLRRSTLTITIP